MKNTAVFRKVSLDRLSSPEQLDQLLPVTDRRGWIALAAMGAVLLAGVCWGVLGSIPQNVRGTGILIKSGGVLEVIPMAGGMITDVAVNVGDAVTEGQVVARMAQPEIATRLQEAKATVTDLRQRHKQLEQFGDENMRLQAENLKRQRAAVEQSIASARAMVRWTAGKIRIQSGLVAQGLLLKQTLLENREKKQQASPADRQGTERAGADRGQGAGAAQPASGRPSPRAPSRSPSWSGPSNRSPRSSRPRPRSSTPYTGRILEVVVEQGTLVSAGEPVLRLDLAGRTVRGLEAIIFVPSGHGKQIRAGMPVLIAPTTVKQEEYGQMLAKVTSVSDFPATVKGMQRMLKNEKLVAAWPERTRPTRCTPSWWSIPRPPASTAGRRRRGRRADRERHPGHGEHRRRPAPAHRAGAPAAPRDRRGL